MVGYGRAHGVGLGASAKPTAHLSAENERGVSGERKEEVRRAREPHHRHQSGFSHDKQSSVFFFFSFLPSRVEALLPFYSLSFFFFFCVCVYVCVRLKRKPGQHIQASKKESIYMYFYVHSVIVP